MKKIAIVLLAGAGVLALGACSSGGNPVPAAATAPLFPSTSTSPSAAPSLKPQPSPAPAKTVYVTPDPAKTVYVVPGPARTVYVPPAPNSGAGGLDGNLYPINSQGSVINVRVAPTTASAIVGTVVQDQYVHITCTTYGEPVAGPWGTTTLWDHIDSPYYGYVSDEWVNTATGAPVVGSC